MVSFPDSVFLRIYLLQDRTQKLNFVVPTAKIEPIFH